MQKGVAQINQYHTLSVYKSTCVGLFERHKLLFSLQLCFKIMMQDGKVPQSEFNFFCYGGVVADKNHLATNPFENWMNDLAWGNVCQLDRMEVFQGLIDHFHENPEKWEEWYTCDKPEQTEFPPGWETKLNALQKLCMIRALHPDCVLLFVIQFISNNIGPAYANPPSFNLIEIF